jgi:thiosulfate dehydrogenase [quinone] large subunit
MLPPAPGDRGPAGSAGASHARRRQLHGWDVASLLLRFFLGGTFVYAGVQKLADPSFLAAGGPGSLHDLMAALRGVGPFGGLAATLAPHAPVVGWIVAVAEIATGGATLAGVAPRLAACCGAALSTLFWVTVDWSLHPFFQNPDPIYAVTWVALLAAGSGPPTLGSRPRLPEAAGSPAVPSRRRFIGRLLTGTGALAALSVLAGLAAAAHHGRRGGGGAAPSERLAVSSIAVGGAVAVWQDTANAAWVIQPEPGRFVGLSGICTHAACPLQFVPESLELDCPCHGSRFDARTGAVLEGPATEPLPPVPLVRSGAFIKVG